MEQHQAPESQTANETSIFDELKPIPLYYSQRAIYTFSILCGALFGSVLMAMNLNRTPSKKGVNEVIAFGILFTVAQVLALQYLLSQENSGSAYLFGIIAGLVLRNFFWKKYLGLEPYKIRSITIPAIIGVLIFLFFVWLIFMTKQV